MSDVNYWTELTNELGAELGRAITDAKKSKSVPFGMEAVSPDTAARRWAKMGPEQKMKYGKQNGFPEALAADQRAREKGYHA